MLIAIKTFFLLFSPLGIGYILGSFLRKDKLYYPISFLCAIPLVCYDINDKFTKLSEPIIINNIPSAFGYVVLFLSIIFQSLIVGCAIEYVARQVNEKKSKFPMMHKLLLVSSTINCIYVTYYLVNKWCG
jgi:hypothetical protein